MTDVDPELFYDAASAYKENSDVTGAHLATLSGAGGGNAAGSNGVGPAWSTAFDATADQAGTLASRLVNALHNIGNLLQQNGINHDQTEAASTLNQRDADGDPVAAPGQAEGTFLSTAVDIPSVAGGDTPEPPHWDLIAERITDGWPNGKPADLTAVGTAWETFGHNMVAVNETAGPEEMNLLANTEAAEIAAAADRMNSSHVITIDVAAAAGDLSRSATEYGGQLQSVQSDITFICKSLHAMLLILGAWPPQLRLVAKELKKLYTDIAVMQVNQLNSGLRVTAESTIKNLNTAATSLAGSLDEANRLLLLAPRKVAPTPGQIIRENQRKGAEAERRAGIDPTKKRRIPVINRRRGRPEFRIPDELTPQTKTLREVKNVERLNVTRQIDDMAHWAQANGYRMVIVIDDGRTNEGTVEQRLEAKYPGLDVVIDKVDLS